MIPVPEDLKLGRSREGCRTVVAALSQVAVMGSQSVSQSASKQGINKTQAEEQTVHVESHGCKTRRTTSTVSAVSECNTQLH